MTSRKQPNSHELEKLMPKASFLLIMRPEHLCKGKPSVTAGRKAKGSQLNETARLPEDTARPNPRESISLRSHRVLGRTMSDGRSPPRGNSGGFSFASRQDAKMP